MSEYDMTLPWFCDFGQEIIAPDDCNMTQDLTDRFNWTFNERGTETSNTGPKEDSWDEQGE